MARFSGFDYERNEPVQRTKVEWREWIKEQCALGGFVTTDVGETFIRKRQLGSRSRLIAEVYATPCQLGVKAD